LPRHSDCATAGAFRRRRKDAAIIPKLLNELLRVAHFVGIIILKLCSQVVRNFFTFYIDVAHNMLHIVCGPAIIESRLHDVVAKAAQVICGPNLFWAVNGFFLS
jgi:hypothetical protein